MRKKHRYTGNTDGDWGHTRPGVYEFINHVKLLSDNAFWDNGTYVKRDMRGKPGTMSVHATGRAVDLSYRKTPTRGKRNSREMARHMAEFMVQHADTLGIEMLLDYWPEPYGRGYRWDRGTWQNYKKPTLGGAPGGDWLHVELNPQWADDPSKVRYSFRQVFPIIGTAGGG